MKLEENPMKKAQYGQVDEPRMPYLRWSNSKDRMQQVYSTSKNKNK